MRRPILLVAPVVLAILVGVVFLAREGPEPPEQPAPEAGATRVPAPEQKRRVVPGPPSVTPAPPLARAPAEAEGRMLHDNALRKRVDVYVKAALRGDQATAGAIYTSLEKSRTQSLLAVRERRAFSQNAREREILDQLIGALR